LPTLFSYVVQTDYGSAPNPFWGVCALVICKPKIRRCAQVGDWIVGTSPTSSPIGNILGMMIYAMQVTDKMPMHEYDAWAQERRPEKVLHPRSGDPRLHVGMLLKPSILPCPLRVWDWNRPAWATLAIVTVALFLVAGL